jgi:hypothetical protein
VVNKACIMTVEEVATWKRHQAAKKKPSKKGAKK